MFLLGGRQLLQDRKFEIGRRIVRHCIEFAAAMLILSIVVFYFSRLAPGDPLQSFYGEAVERMSAEQLTAARQRLGLDAPIWVQYVRWIQGISRGDFGLSLRYRMPAMDVIAPLIGNTLVLGGTGYILVFLFSILLAMVCARFEDSWLDKIICKVGTITYYIPSFWLGIMLIMIFSVNLHWLPSSGAYDTGMSGDIGNRISHMILPLIVMIFSHLWYYTYLIRNKLLDEVRKDYVLLARSKGLGKSRILWKHCLRNVAPTIVNLMAISIPHVLSGTYVAEAVFDYAGIGSLGVESAKYHDYNLLMLVVMITGILVILSSMAAQMINEMIDPRMRLAEVNGWKHSYRMKA